jgi:hypothetical protein
VWPDDESVLHIAKPAEGLVGSQVKRPHLEVLHIEVGNDRSYHHPSSKQAVLSTLVHRARALCDQDSLQVELVFLRDVFRQNGYNNRQIYRVLNRRPNISQPGNKPGSVAFLHYIGTECCPGITSNQWACLQRKYLVSSGR